MTRIDVYNIQECGRNHVAVVEEQEYGYRVSFAGLPDSFAPVSKSEYTRCVLPISAACNPREAALMLAIHMQKPIRG